MRTRSGFPGHCAPATPVSFPAPSRCGWGHRRGQELPRAKVSLQQCATSFQPRLCNPATEQISLVERQKKKKRGKKGQQKEKRVHWGGVWGEVGERPTSRRERGGWEPQTGLVLGQSTSVAFRQQVSAEHRR